jgi:hypothetical protein
MKTWRTTEISAETLAIFVSLASCCAAILALDATPLDDGYIAVLNGIIALLLAGIAAYRFRLGTGDGMGRSAWIIASIALTLFAVAQVFEDNFETAGRTLLLEDVDDVALLLVLPVAILMASRADRIGRNAMLLVAAAVVAQIASTALDLLDDHLAQTEALSFRETEVMIDLSEFVFLQLYLIGLAISPKRKAAPVEAGGRAVPRGREISWLKRHGLTPKRFYAWHIEPVVWRLRNPGRTPEDYYASRIRRQIRKGHFHPAIGQTARSVRAQTELLDVLLSHGLKPSDTVVDYGCGSFRLGQSLIEYLEPGKYWGLDVVEDFMSMGLELMDPVLIAAKQPNALVINAQNIARTRTAEADFVVSWHVCSKVPPHRLSDYFGKMIALMGPRTLLLVHFPETKRRRRQSRFSWAETRAAISEVIQGIDPRLEIAFAPVTDHVERGVRQTMVLARRRS